MIALTALLAVLGLGGEGLTEGMGAGAAVNDLPTDARADTALLNERLLVRHPPGSPVGDLVGDLRAEGFEISEAARTATLTRMDWLCQLTFDVSWQARDGALVSTDGLASGVCM